LVEDNSVGRTPRQGDSPAPPKKARRKSAADRGEPSLAMLQARLAITEETIDDLKRRLLKFQGVSQSLRDERRAKVVLERRLQETERLAAELHRSLSWRITAPLRSGIRFTRWLMAGISAWVLMRPGSRTHRIAMSLGRAAGLRRSDPAIDDRAVRYLFVDHTIACPTNTGVQRVVRGLAKAMLDGGEAVRFVKWSAAARACVLIDAEERASLGRWNGPPPSPAEAGLYPPKGARPVPIAARRRPLPGTLCDWLIVPEVTHITFQDAPVTAPLIAWAKKAGLKSGFIFYDAIPLRRPEFAATAPVHAHYMRELTGADAVWPISRWSASELVSFWGVAADGDRGYLPAVRPIHLPSEFDQPRTTDKIPGEKLILSVGTVEPRKNQTALIAAFRAVLAERPDCDWRLALAGNLHPDVAAEVRAATGEGSPIAFLGHVPDADLSALYARSAFTVFPSLDEGFGLPILESLWSGTPCVCADFGAMGEVAGGGGCLAIDMRDPAQIKSALERLMDDEDLRRALSDAATLRPMSRWSDYLADLQASIAGGEDAVYFWVDATIHFAANTGIQRVARQLARGLIDAGQRVIPVKWGGADQPWHPVSDEELAHFALWNGPGVDQWAPWTPPQDHRCGWFIMAELPLNLSDAEQKLVRHTAEAAGLKSAAVFYDVIPWKMRDVYPAPFAAAHRDYIGDLAQYDLVLAISEYSRREMISVLETEFQLSPRNLGNIQACLLPAEFPEQAAPTAEAPRPGELVEILSVGTIEPRKNHERLLDAFDLACRTSAAPLHLTLVGGGHSFDPSVAERVRARVAANPKVDWVEHADDIHIRQLYGRCDFTIYPSVEEGFGLPILESLSYGKPCICADFGSMLEVAGEGGGCVTVDVRDPAAMAAAMCDLANSPARLGQLVEEARARPFRSWSDYARDVADRLGLWTRPSAQEIRTRRQAMGLNVKPKLSVCISTYNRAAWLSTTLRNIEALYPEPVEGVEFVVCDNASTDNTPEVVRPYLVRPDVVYRRNSANVGMLGNLRETALAASGDYVWILGDDDLLKPGAVERVLQAIETAPESALIYLNYAYTGIDNPSTVVDFDRFFADAVPIVPPEDDMVGPIREICARNENFFTAIYTLVFRRDHAVKAYSQDTRGRPFSSMLTCIPTTYYVLHHLMEEPGVWIGSPQVVVNLNVSWTRYAPLWVLERIPEVYEVARQKGVSADNIDRWRRHTLEAVEEFFEEIFGDDPLGNAAYFSPARLVRHFGDLPEFEAHRPRLIEIYRRAHAAGHPAASDPPSVVFPAGAKAVRAG
jgi:glycosyltransferase involved in cell wall biosynthesis